MKKEHQYLAAGVSAGIVATLAVGSILVKSLNNPGEPSPTRKGGIERWSVKTGTDPAAKNVKVTVPSSVDELIALSRGNVPSEPNKANLDDPTRYPLEMQKFAVKCVIRGYKKESDDDYHIVISDNPEDTRTMIVEIPDPEDIHGPSPFLKGIQNSRNIFEQKFQNIGPRYTKLNPPVPATIIGVGFFDYLHGQTGVAPNGVELHPVTDISFE